MAAVSRMNGLSLSTYLTLTLLTSAIGWSPTSEELAAEGKRQYEIIQEKLPRYGECWTLAVEKLHVGCKGLTEDVHTRLALAFANCFLKNAGRRGCECSDDRSVVDCLKDVDDTVFTSYGEFFTHTQSICFYLQNQIWQARAEKTVQRLSETSKKVSEQMVQTQTIQTEILRLEEKSMESQRQLLDKSTILNEELEKSRRNVREAFEEFSATTSEQRLLIAAIFDRVSSLQAAVLGEFTIFYSFFFYVLTVIAAYMVTSTSRTSGARFWLFVLWTINMLVERMLATYYIPEVAAAGASNSIIYDRLWFCRKVSFVVASCILVWFSTHFKDYNKMNSLMLEKIQRQNEEIKHHLQPLGTLAAAQPSFQYSVENCNTSTPVASGNTYDESDDSTYDSTFIGSSSSSSESEDSSWASLAGTEHSRSNTPIRDILSQSLRDTISSLSPMKYSVKETMLSNSSSYNLRPRKKMQSPNAFIQMESPRRFEELVKKQARVSRINSERTRELLESANRAIDKN